MSFTVMIDGELVSPELARVSVFDRGFLYGDSVFETLRTYGGKLFALDEHLARLERSAASVFIPLPIGLDALRSEVLATLAAHPAVERYARLTLTRGIGRTLGLDPELADQPTRVIVVTALDAPSAELYERGISVITFRAERPSDASGVAAAKIGNYLLAVLAMRAARERGAREALLVDSHGNVLEGATSNVFAVVHGKLVTPPESAPILPGITRAHVLRLAAAQNLEVELRVLARTELDQAAEVFVCSSIREILPVVSIDGRLVSTGVPGPTTRALTRYFREATGSG